ncbi:XK-related protein 9 [Anopheles darlingi]|nr:XK-related protein 9 [Anopheles darlingi]XP_049547999.1 XK-related protein 9 [Anopheles darlingi]
MISTSAVCSNDVQAECLDQSTTDGAKLSAIVGQQIGNLMRADEPEWDVNLCDVVLAGAAIVMRLVSIALTVMLSYEYYQNGRLTYLGLTVASVLAPALITAILSLLMYIDDTRRKRQDGLRECHTMCCVLFLPFLGRYWHSFRLSYACYQAKRRDDQDAQKRSYEQLVLEDSDVSLLRIFECLLEVTLQKILQLTIVLTDGPVSILQMLSIITAMGSIAWCMASHYRCIRFARLDKRRIMWSGTIIQIAMQYAVTIGRVLAIATIASVFPYHTALACGVHAIIMAIWIYFYERPSFCGDSTLQCIFLSCVFGSIFIFNYIPLQEGSTRLRYSFFYTLCFLETIACGILYGMYTRNATIRQSTLWFTVLCCFPTVTFIIGISLMGIFYRYFHPNIISRQLENKNTASE